MSISARNQRMLQGELQLPSKAQEDSQLQIRLPLAASSMVFKLRQCPSRQRCCCLPPGRLACWRFIVCNWPDAQNNGLRPSDSSPHEHIGCSFAAAVALAPNYNRNAPGHWPGAKLLNAERFAANPGVRTRRLRACS